MKYPCDLGKCVGCGNSEAWPYTPAAPSDKHYPVMYLDGVEDLPTDGEMTIKFHVKEKTERTVDGVETCNSCLEIREILSVKGRRSTSKAEVDVENPGDNLDKMLNAMLAKKLAEVEDAD
jgi:hypothetical protein